MRRWRVRAALEIEEPQAALDRAYAREVRWAQGFRVNVDSRLVLLGMRRLLSRRLVSEGELRAAAVVAGCRLGAMDSYEAFDCGLAQGREVPLAFAYALPCIPLACASICHSLRGITYTLTGAGDAGILAFQQAAALIESGAADIAIAGCWESPSATAGDPDASCRLLLLVLEHTGVADIGDAYGCIASATSAQDVPASPAAPDTIVSLKSFLARHGIAAPHAGLLSPEASHA